MTTILLNEDALTAVETIIHNENFSADDIVKARNDVCEYGIRTPMGDNTITVGDLLSEVLSHAYHYIEAEHQTLLDPLKKVLDMKMPDSEFLKSIEQHVQGNYEQFLELDYHTLEPFVVMAEQGALDPILKTNAKAQIWTPVSSPLRPAI